MILLPSSVIENWSICERLSTISTHLPAATPSHLAFLPVDHVLGLKADIYTCALSPLSPTFSHLLKELAPATLSFLSYMVNFLFVISSILKQTNTKKRKKKEKYIIFTPLSPSVAVLRLLQEIEKNDLYLLSPTLLLPLFLKHVSDFGSIISLKLHFARTFIVSMLLNLMVNSHLTYLINSIWHRWSPPPPPAASLTFFFVFQGTTYSQLPATLRLCPHMPVLFSGCYPFLKFSTLSYSRARTLLLFLGDLIQFHCLKFYTHDISRFLSSEQTSLSKSKLMSNCLLVISIQMSNNRLKCNMSFLLMLYPLSSLSWSMSFF